MKEPEEILARLVELIKTDAPLHDAMVRWINGLAASEEAKAEYTREKKARLK